MTANNHFLHNSQQLSQIMSQVEGADLCSQPINGDEAEIEKLRDNVKKCALFSAMSECEENDEMEGGQ